MKTNLDKLFKSSEDLETKGIWFDVTETTGFLVKRFGGLNSQAVKQSMAKHYKPYARLVENGTLDPQKEKQILAHVFVSSCLVDWRGVEIEGVVTPFSKDVAINFLTELPELLEALMAHATKSESYREELGE